MNVTTLQGCLPPHYFQIIDQDISSLTSELSERGIQDTFDSLSNAIDRVEGPQLSLTDLMSLCERFDKIQTLADQTPTSPLLELLKGKIVRSAGRLIKLLKHFPDDTDSLNKRINYLQTIADIECERNQNEMIIISFYSQILFLSEGQLTQRNREGFLRFYENFLQRNRHLFKQRLGLDLVSDHPQENFRRSLQLIQQLKSQGVSFALLSDLCRDAREVLSKQSSTETFSREEANTIRDELTEEISLLRTTPQPPLTEISPIEILWQELQIYRTQFLEAFTSMNALLHTSSIGPSSSSSAPSSSSSTHPGNSQRSHIEHVRQFQKEQFQRFQTFFNDKLMKSLFFVFTPPTQSSEESNFDIRAVGSIGREEPTLFSDIEFFILTRSKSHAHWKRIRTLLDVTCRTFGEGAPTSSDGIESSDFICKGLYLDPFPDPSLEINSPEGLAAQQNYPDAEDNILELTSLLKSTSFTTTDQTLFVEYQEQLTDFSYEKRALTLLRFRLASYKKAPHGAPLINLKSDYLELINHTLNDLSLYHRIPESNTLDIIEALVNQGVFTQVTGALFQDIVAKLYLLRIEVQTFYLRTRAHSKHYWERKSSEEILLRPANHPSEAGKYLATPQDRNLLTQARYLILIPLYAKLEEILSYKDSIDSGLNHFDIIKELLKIIIRLFETKQQHELSSLLRACSGSPPSLQLELYKRFSLSSAHEPLRKQYIDLLEESVQQGVLQQLLQIANPTGYRQKDRVERKNLQQNIEAITTSEQETPCRIECPFISEPRYLRREVANQIIDSSGNLKSEYADVSMNRVCSLQHHGIHLHFKQAPVSDKGSPFFPGKEQGVSRLMMRLFGHGTSFSELVYFRNTHSKKMEGYFVLISQTVFGTSLAHHLTNPAELAQLDPKRLSELFLSIPLILPGDHRPVNFMIEEARNEDGQQIKQLVCIDNDVAWIKPLQIKKILGRTRVTYNLYSPLFFIFPNFILDPQAIEAFLSLRPGPILKQWFEELIQLNQNYKDSFSKYLPSLVFPFFAIDKGMGGQIFVQFCRLQSFLRKHRYRPIYAEEILKTLISFDEGNTAEIGQMLYEKYQEGKTLTGTASDKVKRVTGRDTKQSLSLSQSKAVMFKHLSCDPKLLRPEQSMLELEAILSIYFGEITVSQGGNQISRIEKGFKEVIKSDGSPDIVTQEVLLESILTLTCDKLILSHCAALTDDYLIRLIRKNGKTLTYLDLRDCQTITKKSVSLLSENCPFLQHLYLSGCISLTIFSGNGLRNNTATLLFLQELHIARCPNLLSIHLQSYALNTLKANDNHKLATLELDVAIQPELDVSNCPLLKGAWRINMHAKIANNRQQWNIEGEAICQLYSNAPSPSILNLNGNQIGYLEHNQIHPTGATALTESLKLNISLSLLDLSENKIGDTGATALADHLKLNSFLSKLHLGRNQIGPTGATALADSLKLNSSLSSLNLRYNQIGDTGATAFADFLKLNSSLSTLNLVGNHIGDIGATALAASLKLNSSLSTLNLLNNQIGPTGAIALAASLKLNSSLSTLNLFNNQIGPTGATALADSLKLNSSLSSLDLKFNLIGDAGATALADSLKFNSSLSSLDLYLNHISDTGATALADSLKLNSSVSTLVLGSNQIGDTGATALADSLKLNSSLSSLDLSYNQIGDAGAIALADSLKFNSSLSSLDLSHNQIGPTGATALADSLTLNSSLSSLDLGNNQIGPTGATALADSLKLNSSLSSLDLRSNQIGDTGATALADSFKLNSSLSSLNLNWNEISNTGSTALVDSLAFNFSLSSFDLGSNQMGDIYLIEKLLKRNRDLKVIEQKRVQGKTEQLTPAPVPTIPRTGKPIRSHDTSPLFELPQLHPMSSTSSSSNQSIEEIDYQDTPRASVPMASCSYSTTNPTESFVFRYNSISYQRKFNTREDGACALHSLLGRQFDDEYIWNSDEIESSQDDRIQLSAKANFLVAVEAVLHQGHPLRNLLIQCMEERLVETLAFKSEIFPIDEELSRLEKEIYDRLPDFYFQHQEQLNPIFAASSIEFNKLKSDLEAYLDISSNLLNCFNANFDTLKSLTFQDPKWEHLLSLKSQRIHFEEQRVIKVRDFLMRNFDLYAKMTQKSSCYLTMDELKLAAEVLLPEETRVLVFFDLHQEPHVIHSDGQGTTIAIEHSIAYHPHGQHFSRLECIGDAPSTSTA